MHAHGKKIVNNGTTPEETAALPPTIEVIKTRLAQYQLIEVLDTNGKVKKDPATGEPVINGVSSYEIQSLLMQALQGDPYLDGWTGQVWRYTSGHGIAIGDPHEGNLAGKVVFEISLDKNKISAIDPKWPTEILGVPIRYEIRGQARTY